jgi:DNA-directed RNA polymerase specialized sigma24 family protein
VPRRRASWPGVGENHDRKQPRPGLSGWEEKLVSVIARKFERREPEELEAELIRTVLELKARPPPGLRDWERYLAKALHNRANNWVRDLRAKARRESALPEPGEESLLFSSKSEVDPESQVALAQLSQQLQPELRNLLELLIQAEGNQTKVARRLRVHRNTVRLWIRKLEQVLVAHGFQPGALADRTVLSKAPRTPNEFVLSSRLWPTFLKLRLSGTQWRILLWLVRETSRCKQKTIPFSWYRLAHALSLDRSDVCRAGRRLLQAKILSIRNGRIGLQKEIRQSAPTKNPSSADDPRR